MPVAYPESPLMLECRLLALSIEAERCRGGREAMSTLFVDEVEVMVGISKIPVISL
jgi:hypothetical protein